MDQVLDRVRSARRRLEAKDEVRDRMLNAKRGVTSTARETVNLVHQGRTNEAKGAYEEALDEVEAIRDGLEEHPDLWQSGALRNALQEVAEAWAVLRLTGEDIELPEHAVTPEALLLGVADAVGELRRDALDSLIEADPEAAAERLAEMETLYEELRTVDVPSGIVDVKHKVDVARTLVDKTRGKVALGRIEDRLSERAASKTGGPGTDQERG